jgi:glucose-1-phosphate cytidylyltransferase
MVTYRGGVCNVNLQDCLNFTFLTGIIANMTAVRPSVSIDSLIFDGDLVSDFTEKPPCVIG